MLAPSVHNTQPWRFVIDSHGLEIYADRTRQLAVLDPTSRQLHVIVGCALLNARVSLAASYCPSRVLRLPDPDHPALMARVDVDDAESVDPALAALDHVIDLRQTNRRRFATDPVPPELVLTLVSSPPQRAPRSTPSWNRTTGRPSPG